MSPDSSADTVTTDTTDTTDTPSTDAPVSFREAVESMAAADLRAGISLTDIRAPQRLAPYSHAVGLEVDRITAAQQADGWVGDGDGDAFGRLILLHDPAGDEGPGLMRLVAYIQADMDAATVGDPLLPDVAWEWLTDGLDGQLSGPGVGYKDLGGTVTSTTSVRHGDIGGPPRAHQLEMRASWSATGTDLSGHVAAFSEVLASVAGLPPAGVAALPSRGGH
ncbi:Protein of unknown function (DUF3000) [Corynebacterium variabile]|uniref:DUF3000 domain-containing protein n=1 Tax=Corynebacterium variabile TaxID=1727 RepID=A0A0X2NJ37_9CORY|nr:Protein of unknown function (DUF3000) [Corynebacterium variabile]